MALHTIRNSDGNLYVRYLYWNDDRWNWSNNWLDNDWNDNNPAALRANLFTSHPALAGLSFGELTVPAAEHPADFVYFLRECDVFRIVEGLRFPEHHEEYFERVHLSDSETNIGLFLVALQEAGKRSRFNYFHKQSIYSLPERMSMELREYLIVSIPQHVCALHSLK